MAIFGCAQRAAPIGLSAGPVFGGNLAGGFALLNPDGDRTHLVELVCGGASLAMTHSGHHEQAVEIARIAHFLLRLPKIPVDGTVMAVSA